MRRDGLRYLRFLVTPMLLAGILTSTLANAQGTPPVPGSSAGANPIVVAQELYRQAFFAEAVQSLKVAFATGRITPDEWGKANEWLARSLVRGGNRVGARAVFRGILDRDAEYRPDALRVPKDEIDVFNLALADFREWQVRQLRRVPVSLGLYLGKGTAGNKDFADLASIEGGEDRFKGETEFGGSVRFPIAAGSGGWSVEVELGHFRGTNSDTLPISSDERVRYSASALPLVLNLVRGFPISHGRINALVGAGILLAAEVNMRFLHDHNFTELIPVTLAGRTTGMYFQGGAEFEYPIQQRVSLTARGIVRRATTGDIEFERPNFLLYDPDPNSRIGGRSLDFSGFAATVGLRTFIGF